MKKALEGSQKGFVAFLQAFLLLLSYSLAFFLIASHSYSIEVFLASLPILLSLRLLCYWRLGLFRSMLRYAGFDDIRNLLKGAFLGTLLFMPFAAMFFGFETLFLLVTLDLTYNLLFLGGLRFVARLPLEDAGKADETWEERFAQTRKRLLIVGAGEAGAIILREMQRSHRFGYEPIGFVDDDRRKHGSTLLGLPVLGSSNAIPLLVRERGIDLVVIAIPSASAQDISRVVGICRKAEVNFKTLPFVGDLVGCNVTIQQIRDVGIEDLLGRQVVSLDMSLIREELQDKTIMVTGAAGSIGSELVRRLSSFEPAKIVLFDRNENDLFHLGLELRKSPQPPLSKGGSLITAFVPVIGDVRDEESVMECMARHKPHYVFHAAAYKHVPLMEESLAEAIKNNVLGTRVMAKVAAQSGVGKFVLISTDKAVRPTNIMGMTKRVAELTMQAMNFLCKGETEFIAVRFGNVLGSNGSVIPLFRKQIAEGGPVTVTHPEVTRYFMTIPEAVQLLIQAGAMGKGGEILLLEMGEPVRIADLARSLIRLSGKIPDEEIRIAYTGLRPGEKLYEELLTEGEDVKETLHGKIKVLQSGEIDVPFILRRIDDLMIAAKQRDEKGMKSLLKELVPEYGEVNQENCLSVS